MDVDLYQRPVAAVEETVRLVGGDENDVTRVCDTLLVADDAMRQARRLTRKAASDLAAHDWLMPDDSLSHLAAVRWLEEEQLHKQAVFRAESLLTLAGAARSGMGLAILPCYLADPDPMLARLCRPIGELASDLWLLTLKSSTKRSIT